MMNISVPDFSKSRVLVLGDLMLDRSWSGSTGRISPEAPVPVVKVQQLQELPGGAANVAINLASLQAKSFLLGITGDDNEADTLARGLSAADIQFHLHREKTQTTTTKLRVLSRHQQLIRLDFEEALSLTAPDSFMAQYQAYLDEVDVVILSDYGKGTLDDPQPYIQAAKAKGKLVLVDPKHRDFSRYRGVSLIKPNWREFEECVGHCDNEDEIIEKGLAVIKANDIDALLLTRGEHGMTLIRQGEPVLHLPARVREVFDVTGAGDTVIGVLGAALSASHDLAASVALANVAAGIVVKKLGTASVTVSELHRAIWMAREITEGVTDEDQLLENMEAARARGERIVMTNGCFDVLHAGHVSYLQQAKALGDRLVVAVNDDASVTRLKGKSRPLNPLAERMAVLAALGVVDWVVPFSEDTPARLIGRVLPDCLVKGGDYKPEEIAGGDAVIANGGEVKVLGFKDNCSTTSLIEKIQQQGEVVS